jgi:hypothetical protein
VKVCLRGRHSKRAREFPWRRLGKFRSSHCCKSLRSNAESYEIDYRIQGRAPESTESDGYTSSEVLTFDNRRGHSIDIASCEELQSV